jgi:hypothetical protein
MRGAREKRTEPTILIAAVAFIVTACSKPAEGRFSETAEDLRQAQLLLRVRDEPDVMRRIQAVDEATEAALRLTGSRAAPGKPARGFGMGSRLSRMERFHKAMALLLSARRKAAGTEQAAVRHIDEAVGALRRASAALGIGLPESGNN